METKKENVFTILVQGPLNKLLFDIVPQYLKWSDVVVSTYFPENDEQKNITNILDFVSKIDTPNKLKVIYQKDMDFNCFNSHNIYKQARTVLYGLQLCCTPFTIKTRTDAYFSCLEPFWWTFNKEKISCSDFFYNDGYPMQMSDYIIAMPTLDMIKTFDIIRMWCECTPKNKDEAIPEGRWFGLDFDPVTEAIIFSAYLKSKQIIPDKVNSDRYRKQFIEVIPSNKLGKYIAISNHKKKKFTDEFPNGIDL